MKYLLAILFLLVSLSVYFNSGEQIKGLLGTQSSVEQPGQDVEGKLEPVKPEAEEPASVTDKTSVRKRGSVRKNLSSRTTRRRRGLSSKAVKRRRAGSSSRAESKRTSRSGRASWNPRASKAPKLPSFRIKPLPKPRAPKAPSAPKAARAPKAPRRPRAPKAPKAPRMPRMRRIIIRKVD